MADLRNIAKDAAYVAVGFGVIGFQKAQVRRQELQKQLDGQLGEATKGLGQLSTTVEEQVKLLEERFAALGDDIEARVEKVLDELETKIPTQAREYFTTARTAAKDARGQVRQLVRTA